MRRTILLYLTICCSAAKICNAQAPGIQWQKCYGGIGSESASEIIIKEDGHILITGLAGLNNGDVNGCHGSSDGWIIELDSSGTLLWQRCLGGTSADDLSASLSLPQNQTISIGSVGSNDGDVSGNHNPNLSTDIWVVKLDSNRNVIWQKCYGGTDLDMGFSIRKTFDNGFILCGITRSYNGDVTGFHYHPDEPDIWVVKIDSIGNIEWQKCLGGYYTDQSNIAFQTADSNYIVFGFAGTNDGDITCSHGGGDAWLVKLDQNGGIIWQNCLGGASVEWGYSLSQDDDGNFYFGCTGNGNFGQVSGWHYSPLGWSDIWIVKTDSLGNLIWQSCFGGSSREDNPSIDKTNDGGCIVTCRAESLDGDVVGLHGTAEDIWVLKLDSNGAIQWSKTLGGTSSDFEFGYNLVKHTDDGGFIIAGTAFSNNGDVTGNHGGADVWVVKLNYFALDAAVYEILYPGSARLCDNVFIPELIIRNNAPATLATVNINYQVDGGGVQSYLWTGNLLQDSSEHVSLPSLNLPAGNHTLKIFVSNPNGGVDENPLNDTLTRAFTIDQNFASLPFEEGFQDTLFPPDRWQFYDPDNLFYHLTTTGGFGNSDSCLRVRMYPLNGYEFADLVLPETDFTNLVAPAYMTFSLASAMRNSSSLQTLSIFITTDCENSWTLIYQKEDTALCTTGFHSVNFTPTPNEWRTESVDLTPYIGEPHIQLGIEFAGQFTNNIHIDDINILDAVSRLSEMQAEREGLSCYFVSSTNSIEVFCYANEYENAQVHLLDITGKIVLQQSMQLAKGFNSRKFSTGELSTGIYFGRIITAGGVVAKKVAVE